MRVVSVMTINRAQGQKIKNVGIYLPKPVYLYGQLYVLLSHCLTFENFQVFIEHERNSTHTANIVYYEVLEK